MFGFDFVTFCEDIFVVGSKDRVQFENLRFNGKRGSLEPSRFVLKSRILCDVIIITYFRINLFDIRCHSELLTKMLTPIVV